MKTIYYSKKFSTLFWCYILLRCSVNDFCAQNLEILTDSDQMTFVTMSGSTTENFLTDGVRYDGGTVADDPVSKGVPGAKPFPCIVSISGTATTCFSGNDATASVFVNSGIGPFTYMWTPAPGSGQGTANVTGLVAQLYTVIVSNADGSCMGNILIAQPPAISLNLTTQEPDCSMPPNGSASVTASGGTGPYTYSWNGGPDSNITAVHHLPGGVNNLLVTDAVGCPVTLTFNLHSTPFSIAVTPSNSTITEGDQLQLTASGGLTYSWSPAKDLSCTDCSNPLASPDTTMIYTVTGINAEGCTASTAIAIEVKYRCPDIFVPTIFSPNGDGQNDNLCVMGDCIVKVHFMIYNRWGEKVYETSEPEVCWDGSFNGYPSATGAYVYKLDAVMKDGKRINARGSIAVVR